LDPFSNKPFIYKANKQNILLYSVGNNLNDNGGDKNKDIVIPVD